MAFPGAQLPGGTLEPAAIPKFVTPLLVPPVMPRAGRIVQRGGKNVDYYEISMRQFQQQILPAALRPRPSGATAQIKTASKKGLLLHKRLRSPSKHRGTGPYVKWINELVDAAGNYLPHLLPVDPTLHWANPPGGMSGRDARPDFTGKTYAPPAEFTDPATQYTQYTGPVPMVTHVHGAAGVQDDSDGYAEAWYLPAAGNIPGAMQPRARGTSSSRARPRPTMPSPGNPAPPPSSTRTTSARRPSGTMTTRLA